MKNEKLRIYFWIKLAPKETKEEKEFRGIGKKPTKSI